MSCEKATRETDTAPDNFPIKKSGEAWTSDAAVFQKGWQINPLSQVIP
jgi:hypothetical protein